MLGGGRGARLAQRMVGLLGGLRRLQRRDQLGSPPLAGRSRRHLGSTGGSLGPHCLDELLDAAARRGYEGGEGFEGLEQRQRHTAEQRRQLDVHAPRLEALAQILLTLRTHAQQRLPHRQEPGVDPLLRRLPPVAATATAADERPSCGSPLRHLRTAPTGSEVRRQGGGQGGGGGGGGGGDGGGDG
eukprot:scaffold124969_cov30-Phaeocystis_antarctica.AAC.2